MRWVDLDGAVDLLAYEHDRELVREALSGG